MLSDLFYILAAAFVEIPEFIPSSPFHSFLMQQNNLAINLIKSAIALGVKTSILFMAHASLHVFQAFVL